jgi:hypothetical protein
MELNWTVRDDKPYYGVKEHASVNGNNGFILTAIMTPISLPETTFRLYSMVGASQAYNLIKTVSQEALDR